MLNAVDPSGVIAGGFGWTISLANLKSKASDARPEIRVLASLNERSHRPIQMSVPMPRGDAARQNRRRSLEKDDFGAR